MKRLERHFSLIAPCLNCTQNFKSETKDRSESVVILTYFLWTKVLFSCLEDNVGIMDHTDFIITFSSLMNHVRLAGGCDCHEVQSASIISHIWYFSFMPVIQGFSSGRSYAKTIIFFVFILINLPTTCMCAAFIRVRNVLSATTSQLYWPLLWKLAFRNHSVLPSERRPYKIKSLVCANQMYNC